MVAISRGFVQPYRRNLMTNTAASTQIGLVATYLDTSVDFHTQHRPAPGQAFLCFTHDHLMLEAKLTPCASLLYHWILLKAPAGTLVSFDLKDFRAWTSEHRANGKAYSMKQIRRALGELEDLQLVELQSELIKGRARHPGAVVPLGQKCPTIDKNVPLQTEMSQAQAETMTLPAFHNPTKIKQRNIQDNKQPTHPPVVVSEQGRFGDRSTELPLTTQEDSLKTNKQSHSDRITEPQPEKTAVLPPNTQRPTQEAASEAVPQDAYEAIFDRIASNRIQLNQTVRQTVLSTSLEALQLALAAALEYLQALEAKGDRPKQTKEAILVKAIKAGWAPRGQTEPPAKAPKTAPAGFLEWYKLAQKVGLVSAAQMERGVQFVLTSRGEWEPWEEFVAAFPLAELQEMAQAGRS